MGADGGGAAALRATDGNRVVELIASPFDRGSNGS
jgi:hypothetical protein